MLLHHVGIVVDNLAEAIPIFEIWMNAQRIGGVVEDEAQGARIQLFRMGDDVLLEVVEALPDSPIHATGAFHLCFTVPNLEAAMDRLHDLGARVNPATVVASHFNNRRLAFLATHGGQLVELLEETGQVVQ